MCVGELIINLSFSLPSIQTCVELMVMKCCRIYNMSHIKLTRYYHESTRKAYCSKLRFEGTHIYLPTYLLFPLCEKRLHTFLQSVQRCLRFIVLCHNFLILSFKNHQVT